jgi:ATP-dependent RNA helicase DDX5/DBP2
MGFEKDLKRILSAVRSDRQTLMWSATWPKEVESLAKQYCSIMPVHIQIGFDGISANAMIK